MEPSLSQGCRRALAGLGQVVGALGTQPEALSFIQLKHTMAPASLMHRLAKLTASSVPLRLFPRGCRLQPSPRTPVTSNHDLCNSPSLMLPHSGSWSLCCSPPA